MNKTNEAMRAATPSGTKAKRSMDGSEGIVCEPFIHVLFQRGPVQQVGINGCRIEDVIDVVIGKLKDHQVRDLACDENESALRHLEHAKNALLTRRGRRESQGVLNTRKIHQSQDRE